MKHNELMEYFSRLLPQDRLSYEQLLTWSWWQPDAPTVGRDPRIGIGESFRISLLQPKTGFPDYTVDYYQLIFPYLGCVTVRFGTEQCLVRSGEALLLAPDVTRSIDPFGQEDIAILMSVKRQLLLKNLQQGDLPGISGWMAGGKSWLLLRLQEREDAKWYLDELCCEHFDPDRRTYMTAAALFDLLCISLDRTIEVDSRGGRKATSQTVDAVLRYLKTNCASATLESTARRFGFSPNYLSFLLKQSTGKGFQETRQEECLQQAAQLLRLTETNIAEIAREVGMRNITHFYKRFQLRFGMTPAEYRQENRT